MAHIPYAPAMKDTTGFLVPLDVMNSAACSSAVPPISPIIMIPSVCGVFDSEASASVKQCQQSQASFPPLFALSCIAASH